MVVICEDCDLQYDDVYCLTYCPHEPFDMHCQAMRSDGMTKCCHTIEELDAFLGRQQE